MSGLEVWVVYDHPKDYPDFYVVRKQIAMPGEVIPTKQVWMSESLESLRDELRQRWLTCIPRDPADDPKIIETWI